MNKTHATFTVATTVLIISALFICAVVFKSGKNKRTIYRHRNEYHQIIQHLFDREIVENQFAKDIIRDYPPTKIASHDEYLTLQYFKNNEDLEECCISYSYYVHIIVKDDKLVKAFATEGFFSFIDYVFFDVLSEASEDEYWESRMQNAVTVSNL